ncbi:YchO/YchP family invasin [Erwinia tasmaniensis]|uniref:Invasin n=1 Tax=Erwinia tasmaniensis (strain DSM 17950 / CFBP 7177 / CIP 109463 / NCPPB 4357 / Et1/99) TaxID=465817 RepID=B2VJY3_ERWT9|nr:YchO/YchP family invasin [Erwinia tasmaniensis]CAO96908.1 Putative invasin [Erwinia tasmaniensis Et1/99]
MSPFYRCPFLSYLPLALLALSGFPSGDAWAFTRQTPVPDAPFADPARFRDMQQHLPELGKTSDNGQLEKKIAEAAKSIGEASMNSGSDRSLREEAGIWAFNHFRDVAKQRAASEGEQLLSPYGRASVSLALSDDGSFNGTSAQLLTPWQDNYQYLTFSQLGIEQSEYGTVGNAGLGQRWIAGSWRVGYNAFVDGLLGSDRQRGSLGAEAWGEYLRLSANYYHPLSGWRNRSNSSQMRMARGYDITTRGYLPFYHQLGVTLSYEQYLGDRIDLFNSGNAVADPSAVSLGINYTPVPLFTLAASRKEGEGGESQNQFTLKMNYRIGVPLRQQLSSDNVAEARSLSGSRYDSVNRDNSPVMAFRQLKTLSVFLATPPWQLQPGETLRLKLQIANKNTIKAVSWQGDTQALSLTPPPDNSDPQGWSIIIPAWDSQQGASNAWHLSVTLEDSQQQRVTSNWITLKLSPPIGLPGLDSESLNFTDS